MEAKFELLLEILSEEVPASLHQNIVKNSKIIVNKVLSEYNAISEFNVYSNNLRLVINIPSLPDEIKSSEIKGPKLDCKSEILEAFLKKNNLEYESLRKSETHYFGSQKNKKLLEALPEIIRKIILEISQLLPRSMKWSESGDRWIRPIRNLMCIVAKKDEIKIIPVKYGNLIANNLTYSSISIDQEKLEINKIDKNLITTYKNILKNFNICDKFFITNDDYEIIKNNFIKEVINPIISNNKLSIGIDDSYNQIFENLIENCIYNSQSYNPIINKIDDRFAILPNGIIMLTLINHQKYIPLINNDKISDYLCIAQIKNPKSESLIKTGISLTVSARLEDAVYFYQQDLKKSTIEIKNKLNKIIFHESIGSMLDRIKQMLFLCDIISTDFQQKEALKYAVNYFKYDTVSDLVQEFDELEGHISSYFIKQWIKEDKINLKDDDIDLISMAIKLFSFSKKPCDFDGKTISHYYNHKMYKSAKEISDYLQIIESLQYIIYMIVFAGMQFSSSKDPFAIRNRSLKLKEKLIEINKSDLLSTKSITDIINKLIIKSSLVNENFEQNINRLLNLLAV